ncbi:MAG: HD domain-containing phosphohydrolase [Desulfopila sp.]|jgi:putative two-component system response regulator|nr:HD domain-containing phosphohydrolase [Desulfopila sp.]
MTHQKILVVDDDPSQRLLLKMCLQKDNYSVTEAAHGAEAYTLLEKDPDIRLVVTDLDMPVMNGFDLIAKVRDSDLRYRYIIVLTSAEDKGSLLRALSSGADDYISKPVQPDEIRLRVEGGIRLLRLEIQEELIMSMAKLAEYRSDETGYHLERVQYYTRTLGRDLCEKHPELKITQQLAEEFSRVSPLHDIGKVAIPDSILHKPGKLSGEEFNIMKNHATIGGQLLKDIFTKTGSLYLKIAYQAAMYHHEKYNGKGYPTGLKGENIPVVARVVALADMYDAMTSERCYKKAFSHKAAKKIIVEERGEHLDPKMVDSFLAREKEWLSIRERFKDR